MIKARLLKISALLVLGMLLTLGFSQPSVAAAQKSPTQKCADKLNLKTKSKDSRLTGCVYGYNLGLNGKDKSACNNKFKKDDKAKNACTNTGYPLGAADRSNNNCQGSACSPTPAGQGKNCDSNQCDLIGLYIDPLINVMSLIVGLAVAASIVLGGIQYSASSGDPQKISAAKSRITNSLLAFIAFAFMYAFLNFLVPGGIF